MLWETRGAKFLAFCFCKRKGIIDRMELLKDIKIVLSYLKKYKKAAWKTAVFAISLAFVNASIPYIYGRFVDTVTDKPSVSFLVLALLGIWVLMSLLSALFRRIVSLKGGFIAVDSLCDLVDEQASHILNLPLSFHREKRSGEILSKIIRASEFLRHIIDDIVFWIFPQFLTALIGVIILFFVNWQLALGTIVVFFLSIGINLQRGSRIFKAERVLNKKFEKATGNLNDSFLNVHTIKSCAAEDFQKKKINNSYRKGIAPAFRNVMMLWDNTVFLQETIFSLGFVLVFGYAVFLLRAGVISSGALVMFLGYLNIIHTPLRFVLWQWLSFQRGMTSIKRVRKLLKLKEESYQRRGKTLEEIKGKIDFKNISFKYPGKPWVLEKVNFTIFPGQKIAIVGGSGEGKTTLVDLLSLYFIPTKGKILIDGVDIKKLNLSFLREIIAYVPQEIVLFNDTIKNNILYGKPKAKKEEIVRAAKAANIHHFIESLPKKYNTLVGERGIKLSTGQKQRLALARAIISQSKILILDEATSSLDSQSEKVIQQALERLMKNKTTFIVAHRLSTVQQADKILVLERGEIVEQGTHQELIKKKGAYYNFYSLQFPQKL